tara:strand:+ start:747 stop:2798 length:2052 start_codon:yes stop_codon:yes gene_type:complete
MGVSNDAQVYEAGGPDVAGLNQHYQETVSELETFIDQCRDNYDSRRNSWSGKQKDLRKKGADVVPWEGSSDSEAMVIGERINAFVSMCMFALERAHIRAYPVEIGDSARARVVSSFLKWMRDSYVPRFREEMELAANNLFEKGLAVTYIGYEQREVSRLQAMDIEQIASMNPDFAELLMDENNDDLVIEFLQSTFPKLTKRKARKALRQLRKTGQAELPISIKAIDRPIVQTLSVDTDVFFPPSCVDVQKSNIVHRRVLMSPQEVISKVNTEGWSQDFADEVIKKARGENTREFDSTSFGQPAAAPVEHDNGLVEIIYTYQRLISDENAEGIYCTVWSARHHPQNLHAKYELLNGVDDLPFVVCRLHNDSKRLYDTHSMADLLRGVQWQVKAERDSRIDRASIATLPPSRGPVGRPKPEFRPGGHVTERRPGEYSFMDPPPGDAGSIEVENTLLQQADRMVGLSNPAEDPDAQTKRAFYVNKFLMHVRDVIREAYRSYLRYGPDEMLFRVSGVPEPQQFDKGDPNADLDVAIHFDAQMAQDPEAVEAKLGQMLQLVQYDRTGKIDVESLIEVAAAAIDPVLADSIIQPQEAGAAKMARDVAEDLAMIYAGVEVGARPQGAEIAMQIGQNYSQVPDVAQRMQEDEAFSARLTKYFEQYQFQLTQQRNAEIGRLGTEPAEGIQQS